MGLDMYMHGVIGDNHARWTEDGEQNPNVTSLGYWRKHPNLHGFIVNIFAFGVDDCSPIELSRDGLDMTIEAIKKNELPDTRGFFFGQSPTHPDDLKEQMEMDVEVMEKAKKWLSLNPNGKVFYQASW
jgi:hypothetical protein